MSTFGIGVKTTLKKIFSRKKYIVILILCALISIFLSLYSSGGIRLNLGFVSFSFSNGAYAAFSVLDSLFLPLSALMLCSDFLAHEIADNTIKTELLRPIGRTKLFFSKLTGMLLYLTLILGISVLFCSIIGLFTGHIQFIRVLLSALMILVNCAVYLAFSSFLAVWTGNPSLTMFLGILIYIALSALSVIAGFGAALAFTAHTGWYKMVLGSVIPWKTIGLTAVLFLSYIGVLCGLGQLLFDRRNIQ